MKAKITDITKEQERVVLRVVCCAPCYGSTDTATFSSELLVALHMQYVIDANNLHRGEVELKQELK